MKTYPLPKAIQVLLFFFLVFAGAYFAKPFLAPFSIALLLAMLFLTLSRKIEKRGVSRGVSSLICVLLFAIALAGILTLLSTQIACLTEDLPKLKENVSNYIQTSLDNILAIRWVYQLNNKSKFWSSKKTLEEVRLER